MVPLRGCTHAPGRPLGHVLVPGRFVVAEIADVIDIDPPTGGTDPPRASSQEPARPPHRNATGRRCPSHSRGMTAHLELPLPSVAVRDHAVPPGHEGPRIRSAALVELPQHRQPQVAVHHEGLDRAEPGGAVAPDRHNQNDTGIQQALPPEVSQPRLADVPAPTTSWRLRCLSGRLLIRGATSTGQPTGTAVAYGAATARTSVAGVAATMPPPRIRPASSTRRATGARAGR